MLDLFRKAGQSHSCLSPLEAKHMERLAEISKVAMSWKIGNFICADSRAATLQFWQQDGTPVKMRVRQRLSPDAVSVSKKRWRDGRAGVELLLQLGGIKRRRGGEEEQVLCLHEPIPLRHGKGAPHVFAAGRLGWQPLKDAGVVGIRLEVMSFDRAQFTALATLYRQHCYVRHLFRTQNLSLSAKDLSLIHI